MILPSVSVEGFLWADNSVHPVIENEDVSLSLHTHTTQRHVTGAEGQAAALGGPGGGGWASPGPACLLFCQTSG